MALGKTSELTRKRVAPRAKAVARPLAKPHAVHRPTPKVQARPEKAAERIGAATEELAAGVAEASAAAEELRRSMEQISTAAEEAAGAAQESQGAINSLGSVFAQARNQADISRRKV